ncbi:NAD(P)H-binding protein [Fodinicola acaciae]|uniref:NAD(P)H-binding protein n=1 Tax=Fodinicola acaciae TaxID=2681555 RepID=UPI0013D56EF2|nr:NAD(P)H-binding protein [Fodinicola acaciae]
MILVTGASGTIGSEVLRQLRAAGQPVRAMSRRLAGDDVVRADFTDAESLRKAVDGVDAIFLATAPGGAVAEHDRAMIEAAGARKVVKLSAVGGSVGSPSDWHAPGERALRDRGAPWVALRPTWFASNALQWLPAIHAGQPVPNMTGDGRQAVIDPRDIAEVAVRALRTEAYDGMALTLTGPEAISVPDMVAVLSEELGRQIPIVDVLDPREPMLAAGVPADVVEVAVRGYQLVRAGGNEALSEDVPRVLGRPARTFREWVASEWRRAR